MMSTGRLVGRVARNQAITNPTNTVFSIKRFMGRKADDAEVRRHTEPWMERILYFLGNGQPHRELHLAPAAGTGESAPPG